MYTDSMAMPIPSIPPVFTGVWLAFVVLMVASLWVLFTKAGEYGWASIIPIYNYYVMLKIGGKPWYWLLLMFIPFVNIIIAIMALNSFLKAYGKGGFGSVLLAILFGYIYFPYLAFSKEVKHVRV